MLNYCTIEDSYLIKYCNIRGLDRVSYVQKEAAETVSVLVDRLCALLQNHDNPDRCWVFSIYAPMLPGGFVAALNSVSWEYGKVAFAVPSYFQDIACEWPGSAELSFSCQVDMLPVILSFPEINHQQDVVFSGMQVDKTIMRSVLASVKCDGGVLVAPNVGKLHLVLCSSPDWDRIEVVTVV